MTMALLLFALLFAFMFLGLPISFAIEAANISFMSLTDTLNFLLVPQRVVVGLNSFTLLAIPLFMLAGYIMEEAGLSQRLVDWVICIFGKLPGSMGVVTIVACTIFAALTGSGPATVAAIGAIMLPALLKSGYSRSASAGIIAAGGALGPIIPPSIGMIMYGSTMNVSVPKMFMAAVIPGLMMALAMIIVNMILVKRWKLQPFKETYTAREVFRRTWKALPTLLLPIIILGGIYGGVFTPTEAGCVGCVYALFLGLIYKSFTFKKLFVIFRKTAENAAACVCIGGMANLFAYILSVTKIPVIISNAVISVVDNKYVYLLALYLIMMVVGATMETITSIVILAPILIPIGTAMGLNELHLAMAFCLNLIVGIITPPFGMNLFVTSSTTGESFGSVVKGVLPYMLAVLVVVLLATFIEPLTLWLPSLMFAK